MNRTGIEWVKNPDGSQGYTHNPVSGCKNHTPEGLCLDGLFPCYAYKLANGRLKERYLANTNLADGAKGGVSKVSNAYQVLAVKREGDYADPFYPRFWEERLDAPLEHPTSMSPAKRKGIFVCDMGELFGDWIPYEWQEQIFTTIKLCPYHRFYLLTKQLQNLPQFSPFPGNCFVGVTATNNDGLYKAQFLAQVEAKVRYISFEPLVEQVSPNIIGSPSLPIDWLIIGACTGTKKEMEELCKRYPELTLMPLCLDVDRRNRYITKWTAQPRIEWVREIVEAADRAGVRVFLKDNLLPLFGGYPIPKENIWAYSYTEGQFVLRQEMPGKRGENG